MESEETPERQDAPDEEAGPAVEPTTADQGDQVSEQTPAAAAAPGFDPDAPVATSPPPPEAQSGVPQPTDGSNEGVEPQPQYAGPVPGPGESGEVGTGGDSTSASEQVDPGEGEEPV
jgi:hypothetical protein